MIIYLSVEGCLQNTTNKVYKYVFSIIITTTRERMMEHMYDLNDVNRILQNGFSYILSNETMNHIQKIQGDLGIVNKTNTKPYESYPPSRKPGPGPGSGLKNRKEELSWENVRNFKTTKIEKKEGVEKKINDVRICLNKMSAKNYEIQRDTILAFIQNSGEQEEAACANAIFDIASTNKFYSEMYARLYRELIHVYPVFQKVMDDFLQKYMESLNDIQYADPNIHYDLFCLYTKQSDRRKATAQFLVHMMQEKILSQEYIVSIITELIQKVREYMNMENKINEVEEITELVNIFVSQSFREMIPTEAWNQCIDILREFAKYKLKDKKSLSSRILFKYTDLITLFQSNK